jgi:hypothetical protein
MSPPLGLRVLAVLLLTWEPLTFAVYASSLLTRLVDRGALALALLAARVLVTALGVAAGLALWHERPGAVPLARLALAGAAVVAILTATTTAFPQDRPPGTEGPVLAATLVYYGAWLLYLRRAGHLDS